MSVLLLGVLGLAQKFLDGYLDVDGRPRRDMMSDVLCVKDDLPY